jgi:hypothetical protein
MAARLAALAALAGGIGGMAGGIAAVLWRHTTPLAALYGGIGGIVAALSAAWRNYWRHCGGMAALSASGSLFPHLSLAIPPQGTLEALLAALLAAWGGMAALWRHCGGIDNLGSGIPSPDSLISMS